MSRCERCDACESMWSNKNCEWCNYPDIDKRTPAQIAQDNADYAERIGDDE